MFCSSYPFVGPILYANHDLWLCDDLTRRPPKFQAVVSIRSTQSHDLETVTAAQLARACVVFQIDKIVVPNDGQYQKAMRPRKRFEGERYTGYSDPDDFPYHVLSYLETVQISGRHSSLCTLTS
jgi:hypothetical protein